MPLLPAAYPLSEPVREALEVDLVYLAEDRHHGLLNDFVLQRRDAQRTLPSVSLWNKDSSRRFCPIRSTLHDEPCCVDRRADLRARIHTPATSPRLLRARPYAGKKLLTTVGLIRDCP